jgi:hypothetical protein
MSHRLQIVVLPDLIWLSGFGAAAQTVTAAREGHRLGSVLDHYGQGVVAVGE